MHEQVASPDARFFRPRSWVTATDATVAAALGSVVLIKTLVMLPLWLELAALGSVAEVICLGLIQFVLASCCLVTLVRGRTAVSWAFPVIAATAGLALSGWALGSQESFRGSAEAQTAMIFAAVQLHLMVVLFVGSARSTVVVLASSFPVYAGLRTWMSSVPPALIGAEWLMVASIGFALAVLIPFLRMTAARADEAAASSARTATARVTSEAVEFAAEEAHRVIHDDVISALRGIELGLDGPNVRAACDRALTALDRGVCADAQELLQLIAADAPVKVTFARNEWATSLPPPVVTALLGAAGEALRNVERHSGVAEATISAYQDAHGIVLDITDRGRGLGDSCAGWGITHSIVSRMRQVGGEARVVAELQGGTTVSLAWMAPEQPPSIDETPLQQMRRRTYLLVGAPFVAATAAMAAARPFDSPAVTILVACGIGLLICVAAVRSGGARSNWRDTGLIGLAACGLSAAGITAAGASGLAGGTTWMVDFSAAAIAIYGMESTIRKTVVLVLAQTVTIALSMAALPGDSLFVAPVLLGEPASFGVFAIVIAVGLRGSRAPIAAYRVVVETAAEEQAWRARYSAARARHLAELQVKVGPFLRAASQGALTSECAAEGRRLMQQCRDDLHFASPLDGETHERLSVAREHGLVVNIRAGDFRPHPEPAAVLIRAVLTESTDAEHVTIHPGDEESAFAVVRTGRSRRVLSVGDVSAADHA